MLLRAMPHLIQSFCSLAIWSIPLTGVLKKTESHALPRATRSTPHAAKTTSVLSKREACQSHTGATLIEAKVLTRTILPESARAMSYECSPCSVALSISATNYSAASYSATSSYEIDQMSAFTWSMVDGTKSVTAFITHGYLKLMARLVARL